MSGVGGLAWGGAVAGCVAPLTIGTLVVVGGRRRRSYDPWRNTMTDLGDGTDGVATAFVVVNVVVAVLLGVLAVAVHHTLNRWALTIALIVAAVGSLVFGLTACNSRCRYPFFAGRQEESDEIATAPQWIGRVHLAVAVVVVLDIVVAPLLSWFVLQGRDDHFAVLRSAGLALGITAGLLAIALMQQLTVRRRADRAGRASTGIPGLFERLLWIAGYAWVVVLATSLIRPGWPSLAIMGAWLALALRFVLRPDWRDPSPVFSLEDCQPGTLRGLGRARFGMLRVGAITHANSFCDQLRDALDSGLIVRTTKGATAALTLAITARGLRRLGVPYQWHAHRFVEDAFEEGMLTRAAALGDPGPSDPKNWAAAWRDSDRLHVAFWIQATTNQELADLDERVRSHFASVDEQLSIPAYRLTLKGSTEPRDHFGFVDGISQPRIDGLHDRNDAKGRGGGKLGPRGEPKLLALGEFVVGQVDETGDIFPVPSPPEVFLGGTFLVVRQLEQDVAGFRRYTRPDGEPSPTARRLIGRTRNGTPLAPHDGTAQARNDFTYGNDPEGHACPLGAHSRRVNPRDALGFGSTLSARRRIIRRGMPYGPPWDEQTSQAERGLLFLAYNVRIAEQFEFVQTLWMNDGSAFGLGNAPDPVGGLWEPSSPRPLVVTGRPPEIRADLPSFVTTKGGEYFFVPSMPGLQALADFRPVPRQSV